MEKPVQRGRCRNDSSRIPLVGEHRRWPKPLVRFYWCPSCEELFALVGENELGGRFAASFAFERVGGRFVLWKTGLYPTDVAVVEEVLPDLRFTPLAVSRQLRPLPAEGKGRLTTAISPSILYGHELADDVVSTRRSLTVAQKLFRLSVLCYAVSFALPTLGYSLYGLGINVFFLCVWEWWSSVTCVTWLANPLYWAGVAYYLQGRPVVSLIAAVVAVLLGMTFVFAGVLFGYYVWLGSFLLLIAASIVILCKNPTN